MPKDLSVLNLWAKMNGVVGKVMNHYQDDFFVYDRKMFESAYMRGQKKFIWFVYNSGTHFIEFDNPTVKEHFEAIRSVKGHYLTSRKAKLFLCSYDDSSMKKIDWEKASSLIQA